MSSTDRGARQKDRVLLDQSDCGGLDSITSGLDIFEMLRNVENDALGVWAENTLYIYIYIYI